MSIHDDALRLRTLAESVPVEAVAGLMSRMETIGHALADITGDDEPVRLVRDVLAVLEYATAALMRVRTLVEQVAEHHLGNGAASPPNPTTGTVERPIRPEVESVEHAGSRYPSGAEWALPDLPRRVGDGERHTHARVRIGSREIPGAFQSNMPDRWAAEARQRISQLGIAVPHYLPYHVEMRAAAMLISSGVRDARLVMNNVPCGFRPGTTRGCHQALEHFLPTGTTLTVLGSDSDGRPFHHTYRGRAGS